MAIKTIRRINQWPYALFLRRPNLDVVAINGQAIASMLVIKTPCFI
jgi:hypothetical protein